MTRDPRLTPVTQAFLDALFSAQMSARHLARSAKNDPKVRNALMNLQSALGEIDALRDLYERERIAAVRERRRQRRGQVPDVFRGALDD